MGYNIYKYIWKEMIIFSFEYHLLFAVLILLFIEKYFLPGLGLVTIIGCLLSFYIPDLDQENSKPSKNLPIISWILRLFTKHRGITHSLLFMFIIGYMAWVGCEYWGHFEFFYGVIIGYGSHLFSDLFTPRGVPLLWPYKFNFKFPILSSFPKLSIILLTILFSYLIMNNVNLHLPTLKIW